MHKDEYVARLKSQRRRFSEILGKSNSSRRLQRDQLKVQVELQRLMDDPNASKREIEICRNWLSRNNLRVGSPSVLTPKQQRTKMLMGYVPKRNGRKAPPPERKHKGGLAGFLERLQ